MNISTAKKYLLLDKDEGHREATLVEPNFLSRDHDGWER